VSNGFDRPHKAHVVAHGFWYYHAQLPHLANKAQQVQESAGTIKPISLKALKGF
jgi:hypothetical protein